MTSEPVGGAAELGLEMAKTRTITTAGERLQGEQRDLIERARKNPGVAETMDLYERTASRRVVTRVIRSASMSDRTNPS